MRRVYVGVLCVLLCVGVAHAQQSDDPLEAADQAQRAYAAGDFDTALTIYESLIAEGVQSSAMYFNLATVYDEAGQEGWALLNYMRAQRLAPRDLQITARIVDIQGRRQDVQGEETALIDRLGGVSSGLLRTVELGLLAFLAWTGWFALAAGAAVRPGWREGLRPVLVVFGVVALGVVVLFTSRVYVETYRPLAVITVERTPVFSGPGEDYLLLYELSEAAELRVVQQDNAYARIILPDGRLGWLPEGAATLVSGP